MRARWLALLGVLVSGQGLAQDALAPQGAKIHMHAGDGGYAADGYLFQPPGPGPFSAVLLIPDDRGVADYIRTQASELAAAGHLAVAIDLFRGRGAQSGNPPEADAMHDLSAALTFIRSLPSVRTAEIGIAGWGTGAGYAVKLARSNSDIRAIVLTQADSPKPGALAGVRAALLGNFGGSDNRSLQALAARRRGPGCEVHLYFYPHGQGRFYDSQDAAHFRADDAKAAGARVQEFLSKALGP